MKKPTRTPLSPDAARKIDAYWRAANYLSVGQIYLYDNPAAAASRCRLEHIKPRLLGHWGTTPGLNFIYVHLNRVDHAARPEHDLRHRARATAGRAWWPTPTSRAPTARSTRTSRRTRTGMQRLFKQFSFPGGIPSHVAPETPGSIHEGGELGYSLVARLRRRLRQSRPDRRLRRRRRRGRDRPAGHQLALEQVPQSRARRRGAADPAPQRLQDRRARPCWRASPHEELEALLRGYGYEPYFVEGDDPAAMHQLMAATLDTVVADIQRHPDTRRAPTGSRGARAGR